MEDLKRDVILIVDDEESITAAYEFMLKQEFSEFKIVCFNKCDEAEDFIKNNVAKINIALLDWKLDKGRLSCDLAEKIRKADTEEAITILLLTGTPIDSFPSKTLALYDSILIKPVERLALITGIRGKLKI